MEFILQHAWDLSERIEAGLSMRGRTVISPSVAKPGGRSGNTCFLDTDAAALTALLATKNVLVWGDYGRVRVSGHLYNKQCRCGSFSRGVGPCKLKFHPPAKNHLT